MSKKTSDSLSNLTKVFHNGIITQGLQRKKLFFESYEEPILTLILASMRTYLCLCFCFTLVLYGQEPAYQRFLPQPLDSLSGLDSLTVHFNNLAAGGQPDQLGLKAAVFHWDEQGRIQSAVNVRLQEGKLLGRDSMAWVYRGDSIFRRSYELVPRDRDYRYDAPDLDYGALDQVYLPPLKLRYGSTDDTLIMAEGRLIERRDGYTQTHYRYDDDGKLLEIKAINPETVAMGMGGISWELYRYDSRRQVQFKTYVTSGPDDHRDTTVHVFQYNGQGQLTTEIRPSNMLPGVSNLREYTYEDGLLVRESYRRSTFRSSGPPDYQREQITLHFETIYTYQDGLLVEKRILRNGEVESDGWLRYQYDEAGRLSRRILMNPYEQSPYLIYSFGYQASTNE